MRITARVLTAAAIAATVAAAGTGPAAAAPTPATHRARTHVVAATISASGHVRLPRAILGGYRHIRVTGAEGHALELVTAKHHASIARLVADYQQFARTGLPVRPEADFTFIGGALTGRSVSLQLARGTYFAFDAASTTLDAAHVRTLHVRQAQRAHRRPHATATITAVGSTRWASRPRSIAHRGHLRFVNASHATQLLNLLQLRPHTTLAQVKAVLANPDADPGSIATGRYAETGVLSPGRFEMNSYALPAGEYALICLWPDDRTGRSHSAEGMVRLITLT